VRARTIQSQEPIAVPTTAEMAGIAEFQGEVAVAPTRSFAANIIRVLGALVRREDDCHPQPNVNLCEKPAISSTKVTWIIVGVCV
jgi:hypothetical protein